VQSPSGAAQIDTAAATTAELLADRSAIEKAVTKPATVRTGSLELRSPVTAPCRVVAQMTNYRSHIKDSGMNPDVVPLTFFRKASGSISGPHDDVVKPAHVGFLDYEVEVGLVIGKAMPVGTRITQDNLAEYVAALVVTNDVSARDLQLPKTQFFESKSYPTFTPVGPALVLLDSDELKRFSDLRLRLKVNGEIRQNSQVAADMVFSPVEALQALSRFQRLDAGDLLLTGTPAGTALTAPAKPVELLASLLPPALKWKMFFQRQARNPKYLADGDVIETEIGTDDGSLVLGVQRTVVRDAS
jgi:2-keto-4-pentenoate hydratase/2-oxohepta-3-ene-1,7-dioic acid hydratase in catechol pathway